MLSSTGLDALRYTSQTQHLRRCERSMKVRHGDFLLIFQFGDAPRIPLIMISQNFLLKANPAIADRVSNSELQTRIQPTAAAKLIHPPICA